ncbi:MAG: hypothetical protein ABIL49_06820 [candidate division WOR-3 bacterium]|jgi:hypothetical protein
MLFLILTQADSLKYGDSLNLNLISRWKSNKPIVGIEVKDNYAYLSSLRSIYIIDFSDVKQLGVAPEIKLDCMPIGLKVKGNYLYTACGRSGLVIIDITDPYTAQLVSQTPSKDSALYLDIKGNYLFMADAQAGITVFDISNPKQPKIVSSFKTLGFARGIHIVGNYAYVADGPGGLVILDISNINNIKLVGSYSIGDTTFAITVRYYNNRAYVGFAKHGLYVFDVSNPKDIKPIIRYIGLGEALGLFLRGNYLYLAAGKGGVRIFDLDRVENEFKLGRKTIVEGEVARYRAPEYAGDVLFDIVVYNKYILTASRNGLIIYGNAY